MNLSFIEAFYWAATLKGVGRAAKKLHRTQTAITARILKLEQELNTTLLDRRDKHFRLTATGVRFLAEAERLLDHWREIKSGLGSGAQRTVSLRVGAIESVLHSWLIPWIEQLREAQPELALELTVETTPLLLDSVRRGALDLVLAAQPLHADGVSTRALPSMPMAFVGKQALHTRRRYTLAQLAQHELLTFQRGSQPHVALLDVLREAGLEDARVHTISSVSAMVRLVAGGFGVATLPQAALGHLAATEGLRPLACDTKLVPLPIHASWRADPMSNEIDAIVESAVAFAEGDASRSVAHQKKR